MLWQEYLGAQSSAYGNQQIRLFPSQGTPVLSCEETMKESGKNSKKQASTGKAIVLGGHYSALAVVKALSQEGVQVAVVASDPNDHACHSRYVSELILAPDPEDNNQQIVNTLFGLKKDWDEALLIPTLDEYVIFVSRNRETLMQRFISAVQEWEIINKIINKNLLYPEAQKAEIPTPLFFLPDSVDFLKKWKDKFTYPCILKPFESRMFSEVYGIKVLTAYSFQELIDKFTDVQKNHLDVMISELIPGDDASIFSYRSYIDSRGEVLAEMCTQKLRQYPPHFGQGSVVRTIPMIPEIRDHSLKLLRHLSYKGESSTEYRWDCRDNQYKLMEINTRPVVTEWLFVKAGINFPFITYQDLVQDFRNAPGAYDHELYWIHNHWEVVNFINSLMSHKLNFREFMEPYWKKKVFAIPFFDDPIHFLKEMYSYSRVVLKKIQNRNLW